MITRLGPIGWLILGFFAYGLTQFAAEASILSGGPGGVVSALWAIDPKQVGYWLTATFLFWFVYATLMRIAEKRKKYSKRDWRYWGLTVLGYLLLIPGYPYDVAYNLTYGTLMFWQTPRRGEWTFTARLQRCVHRVDWRGAEARFICRYLVEPWDPGHCGQEYKP